VYIDDVEQGADFVSPFDDALIEFWRDYHAALEVFEVVDVVPESLFDSREVGRCPSPLFGASCGYGRCPLRGLDLAQFLIVSGRQALVTPIL